MFALFRRPLSIHQNIIQFYKKRLNNYFIYKTVVIIIKNVKILLLYLV